MDVLKVYLAGQCKGLEDGGKEWREKITEQLDTVAKWCGSDVKVFNPTKYFSYAEKRHKTQKQVKDYYLHQLSKCDVVLLNCEGTDVSVGTAQEVQYAVDHNIPVIGFGQNNMYPWISEVDCQVVFDSMHEAVDYIRDFYLV